MTNKHVITKATAALAESVGTIVDVSDDQAAALAETFEQAEAYLTKSFADDDSGDSTHHASKVTDLPVESGTAKDRGQALAWLLHHKDGAALLRRMHKNQEDKPSMTREKLEAERLTHLRACNPVQIAKVLVAENSARGISEHEFTQLVTEFAKRENPELTEARAFTKVFSASTEDGAIIREAIEVIKAAEVARYYDTVYPMPSA